ncbi:7541_t:CDS:2, partial [Racocetra fulgida]
KSDRETLVGDDVENDKSSNNNKFKRLLDNKALQQHVYKKWIKKERSAKIESTKDRQEVLKSCIDIFKNKKIAFKLNSKSANGLDK